MSYSGKIHGYNYNDHKLILLTFNIEARHLRNDMIRFCR